MNFSDQYLADTIRDPQTGNQTSFPKGYHAEAAKMAYDLERVMIADEMGVGKTAPMIMAPKFAEYMEGEDTRSLIIHPGQTEEQLINQIQEYTSFQPDIETVPSMDPNDLKIGEDYTLINYGKLSKEVNGPLMQELRNQEFEFVGIDEAHAIRNPGTNRSKNIVKDLETGTEGLAVDTDYLTMITGTPIYNSFKDAFQLIYMLEPENYDDWKDVKERHQNQPRRVANLLETKWRRLELDNVVDDLPDLEEVTGKDDYIDFTGTEHEKFYKAVLENDRLESHRKVNELRKAMQDPALVNETVTQGDKEIPVVFDEELRDRADDIQSEKYRLLEQIPGHIDDDEKVVVYTNLTTGVTDHLADKFDGLKIDASVDMDKRDDRIEEFEDEDYTFLFATPETVGEGLSITGADYIAHLEEPWGPAKKRQGERRVVRRGQKNSEVNIIDLRIKGNLLDDEDEDIPTIDKAKTWLMEEKQRLMDFFTGGRELSEKELEKMISTYKSPEIQEAMYTPQQKACRHHHKLIGQEVGDIAKHLYGRDAKGAKSVADNFSTGWEGSFSYNTAVANKKIVETFTDSSSNILDVGSAFGALSNLTDRDILNLDINKFSFKQGLSDKEGNVSATMNQIPIQDEQMEFVNVANSLYYNSPEITEGDKVSERERTVEELNRVLSPGGKLLVTMPNTMMAGNNPEKFRDGLRAKGFEADLIGYIHSEDKSIDYHGFIGLATKQGLPDESGKDWFNFEDSIDEPGPPAMKNSGNVSHFEIDALDLEAKDERLEDVIRHLE